MDLDIKEIIADVAKRQGLLLSKDDPVLTAALLCEATVRATVSSLEGRFQTAIDTATENWSRALLGSDEEFGKAMARFTDFEKNAAVMLAEYQRRLEGASAQALQEALAGIAKQMDNVMIDARADLHRGLDAVNAAVATNRRTTLWMGMFLGASAALCAASLWIVYVLNLQPAWFK